MARQRPDGFAALVVVNEIQAADDAAVLEAGGDHLVRRQKAQGDELVLAVQFDGVEIARIGWASTALSFRRGSIKSGARSRGSKKIGRTD
jgi:hypothetical protein